MQKKRKGQDEENQSVVSRGDDRKIDCPLV